MIIEKITKNVFNAKSFKNEFRKKFRKVSFKAPKHTLNVQRRGDFNALSNEHRWI